MWAASLGRRDLLAIGDGTFAAEVVRISADKVYHTDASGFTALWRDRPRAGSVPDAIIAPPDEVDDFLAWAATYVPHLQPLTAHCRVITQDRFRLYRDAEVRPPVNTTSALVGAIIMEALTRRLHNGGDDSRPTLQYCMETQAFARARCWALGVGQQDDEVLQGWYRARAMLGLPSTSSFAEGPVHVVIGADAFVDRLLSAARHQIQTTGVLAHSDAQLISRRAGFGDLNLEVGVGPREERLQKVDRALAVIQNSRALDLDAAGFLAAYLVSCIAPGSLDHVRVLLPYLHQNPSALMWLGVIAGSYPEQSILRYGAGLGRRIERELFRMDNIIDPPRADLSLSELLVLSRAASGVPIRPTNWDDHLEVELVPLVQTIIRVRSPKHVRPEPSMQAELDLQRSVDPAVERALEDLAAALRNAENAGRRLADQIGFNTRRSKRR